MEPRARACEWHRGNDVVFWDGLVVEDEISLHLAEAIPIDRHVCAFELTPIFDI